jgi:hypothetical protein
MSDTPNPLTGQDAPDIGLPAPQAPNPSILAGQTPPPVSPDANAAVNAAAIQTAGGSSINPPGANPTPAQPAQQGTTDVNGVFHPTPVAMSSAPAPGTVDSNTGPGVPQAAGQKSVWKDLVMGAIYGLAGSAGSKHFGAGLAGGAAGYVQGKQQEVENIQNAKKLQFESLQAADSHIRALAEIRASNALSDEKALEYKQKSAEYQAFLQDNFGIEPDLSFNDSHEAGTAALQTASDANGGKIPPATIVHQPAPDGQHGTVAAYSPSQTAMKQNQNGFRDIINTQRAAQGLPDIDDQTFNSLRFKGQRDAAQKAIEFFKPTPAYTLDKSKPDYLPVVLEQRKQVLAQYSAHKDVNGNPDANPNVEKQLQASIDYLESAWKDANAMENKQATEQTAATTQAKLDTENALPNQQAAARGAGLKASAEETARQNTANEATGLPKKSTEKINTLVSGDAQGKGGYNDKLTQFNTARAVIKEGADAGSVATNMAPLFLAMGANKAAGLARLSSQLVAAGTPAGIANKTVEMLIKGATGKIDKDTADAMNKVVDIMAGEQRHAAIVNIEQQIPTDYKGDRKAIKMPDIYGNESTLASEEAADKQWQQASSNVAQGEAAKVHKNMSDFKQATPTKEHGVLYTDDGKIWYQHDGSIYQGVK